MDSNAEIPDNWLAGINVAPQLQLIVSSETNIAPEINSLRKDIVEWMELALDIKQENEEVKRERWAEIYRICSLDISDEERLVFLEEVATEESNWLEKILLWRQIYDFLIRKWSSEWIAKALVWIEIIASDLQEIFKNFKRRDIDVEEFSERLRERDFECARSLSEKKVQIIPMRKGDFATKFERYLKKMSLTHTKRPNAKWIVFDISWVSDHIVIWTNSGDMSHAYIAKILKDCWIAIVDWESFK